MKVRAILTVEMEMSEEDFEFTQRACKDGDMQAFLEMTEIDCEGTPTIKTVDDTRQKATAIDTVTGVVNKV